MDTHHIWVVSNKKEEAFLRKKTKPCPFGRFTKKETQELLTRMHAAMREVNGIGLSANQIGVPYRVFVARLSDPSGGYKRYAVFNPKVEKASGEKLTLEEGCLSVPGVWGKVERAARVVLAGFDRNGKPIKVKAWGLLAHIFQHEVDHLNGKLFIDMARETWSTKDAVEKIREARAKRYGTTE